MIFAHDRLDFASSRLDFALNGLDFPCFGLDFKCKCIRIVFMFLLMRGGCSHRGVLIMGLHVFAAYILKGCKGVATIISAVLVLVLLDNVNPAQLWLCGLVRRSVTTVRELGP